MCGWLLAGIADHDALSRTWVFKGGTCLRKCCYETFRFSEDLDFTIVEGGPEEPGELKRIFVEIAEWVREESGIELIVDDSSFRRRLHSSLGYLSPVQYEAQLHNVNHQAA